MFWDLEGIVADPEYWITDLLICYIILYYMFFS